MHQATITQGKRSMFVQVVKHAHYSQKAEFMTFDTFYINRHHESTQLSGDGLWYVCHANLRPDLFGTGFRHRLEPFYCKPVCDMHDWNDDLSKFTFSCCSWITSFEYIIVFNFDARYFHPRGIRYENWHRKCSRFMAPVSGVCVMALTIKRHSLKTPISSEFSWAEHKFYAWTLSRKTDKNGNDQHARHYKDKGIIAMKEHSWGIHCSSPIHTV